MPGGAIAGLVGLLVATAVMIAIAMRFALGDRFVLALPLGVTAFAVSFVPTFLVLRRVRLRLFADGIVVRLGVGRARYVSYDEIERAHADGPALVVSFHRGGSERFEVSPEQIATTESALDSRRADEAQTIAAEINDALRVYRAGDSSESAALALDPRGDASAWLRALRAVGQGDVATFRSGVVPTREELVAVVTSSRAPPRRRLAAAIALREQLTDAEAPRIRVAASACGAPRLRERLLGALDASSDDELAALLEETTPRP